jgi:hypothetical protein
MAFTDKIAQADGITITLNCGFCNQPAPPSHVCGKRYLRDPQVVYIVADGDRYHVSTQSGDERYSIDRETFERGYSEI